MLIKVGKRKKEGREERGKELEKGGGGGERGIRKGGKKNIYIYIYIYIYKSKCAFTVA